MRKLSIAIFLLGMLLLVGFGGPALAQNTPSTAASTAYPKLFPGETQGYFIPPDCTGTNNNVQNCGVRQLLLTAINVSQFILGILGSVTLLMFIYGGFVWLTSAGNSDRVQHGKNIFIGTLVGLAIIFSSSLIINFVVAALSGQTPGGDVKLFQGNTTGSVPQEAPLTIPATPPSGQ